MGIVCYAAERHRGLLRNATEGVPYMPQTVEYHCAFYRQQSTMADMDLIMAGSGSRNPRSTLGISLLSIALAVVSTAVVAGQERAAVERVTIPIKVLRYAQRLVGKYDTDGDGDLSATESSLMNGTPERADENEDGLISLQEMAQHVARYGK